MKLNFARYSIERKFLPCKNSGNFLRGLFALSFSPLPVYCVVVSQGFWAIAFNLKTAPYTT